MKKTSYSRNDLTKLFAFCAMLIAAVVWLLNAFNIDGGGILIFIKDTAVLIAISLPAYAFAKSLGKTWIIIFWIIFAVFAVSLILGSFIL